MRQPSSLTPGQAKKRFHALKFEKFTKTVKLVPKLKFHV